MKDFRIRTFKNFVGELKVTYKRTSLPTVSIKVSTDAADFIRPYYEEIMDDVEQVKVIHLNNSNQVVNVHHLSSGTDTGCLISIKDVLRQAILIKTNGIIIVHNHPSGNLKASRADIDVTTKLASAAKLMDLKLLDHIIITRESYLSLVDEGLL